MPVKQSSEHAQGVACVEEPEVSCPGAAWLLSIVGHGLAVAVALALPRPAAFLPEAPFRWEVTLHEAVPAPIEQPLESREETPPSVRRVIVNQRSVHRVREIVRQSTQPYDRAVPMQQPIARTVESLVTASDPGQMDVVHNRETVEQAAVQTRPAHERAVVPASSVASRGQVSDVSPPVIEQSHVDVQPAAPAAVSASESMGVVDHQPVIADDPLVQERTAIQTKPVRAVPGARAHYGWLKEALTDKIEQMKRYPDVAAERRWEGRVVVRGVITDEGELRDLAIVESSGFHVLDEEALALLRRISPLTLKHPLGQSQVALRIPIQYGIK